MPLAFGPQSRLHAAEIGITLRGDARHVIQGWRKRGLHPRRITTCRRLPLCLVTGATPPCVRNT